MWETAKQILLSQPPWSAVVYLVLGVVVGAIVGTQYSLRAHRPRLRITGAGGGGNDTNQRWSLGVVNQPSFAGQIVDGDAARELSAWLQVADHMPHQYQLFWQGPERDVYTTLEPGQSRSMDLFSWQRGSSGFVIVDQANEPVARFQDSDHRFVLHLRDRLGRITKFKIRVEFDDTHLKNPPRLSIRVPLTFSKRLNIARSGWQRMKAAFRLQ